RGEVAARFWPDVLDSSARQSLRSAVWALRRALGPGESLGMTTREDISLDRGGGRWVDVVELERVCAGGRAAEGRAPGDGAVRAGSATASCWRGSTSTGRSRRAPPIAIARPTCSRRWPRHPSGTAITTRRFGSHAARSRLTGSTRPPTGG